MTVSLLVMDKYLKALRSRSKTLAPALHLGKNGLSEPVITEIKKLVRRDKLIKIRLNAALTTAKPAKEIAKEIAEKTDALLVDCIGHVLALAQKPK